MGKVILLHNKKQNIVLKMSVIFFAVLTLVLRALSRRYGDYGVWVWFWVDTLAFICMIVTWVLGFVLCRKNKTV